METLVAPGVTLGWDVFQPLRLKRPHWRSPAKIPHPQRMTTTTKITIDRSSMTRILVHHAAMEDRILNI
jgi:hypothetical protein